MGVVRVTLQEKQGYRSISSLADNLGVQLRTTGSVSKVVKIAH